MDNIVIIGAGECGVRAAFALREEGFSGRITLVGEEPHLPYERPPLSKNCPVAVKLIAEESRYQDAGIELLLGRHVERIDRGDRSVHISGGERRPYDKLLIATGARARCFAGMEAALTLRNLDDARLILDALRPGLRLAIIGGGFIGLELAATARKLGVEVTVIEAADHLMARIVPGEIAAVVLKRHQAEGVKIIVGAGVTTVREKAVRLFDDRVVETDLVVAGVGAEPETRLAATAGLAIANGIMVNERFATSDPDIFAAGDCCCFPFGGERVRLESWRAAQDQGEHAARAMLGKAASYARVPWFWSDQYDLTLQVTGLPRQGLPHIRRNLSDDAFVLFQLDQSGRIVSASGIGQGNAVAKEIKLAEMMIEREFRPPAGELGDPAVNLKAILKASS